MLEFKLVLCVLLAIFPRSFTSSEDSGPLVNVNLGQVRGKYLQTLSGRRFAAFRGIPYAEPPTGQLRFRPPEKLRKPWKSQPFDANKDGTVCTQYDLFTKKVFGGEDCLVLNVYTPQVPSDVDKSKDFPVMVFIYGGGFNFGEGSSRIYGPRRLLDHDVILVTFNYRVNLFGFLSTGDKASPGNYGLLDQVEALKWIQENIEAFGGDPDKVTIFGESAGGASVSYHLISHLSTGLFSGAIVMSGSPLSPWAYDYNQKPLMKNLATRVRCAKPNSKDVVECLRKLPVESFAESMKEIGDNYMFPFRPTLDRHFLTDHPFKLIKKGKIANRVPLIVGITPNEGVVFYGLIYGNSTPEISDEIIQRTIAYAEDIDEKFGENAVDLVKKRYFENIDSYTPEIFQKKLIKVFGDCTVDAPFYYNLQLYLENGIKPYVYLYDYVTNHSAATLFGFHEPDEPTHVDDLSFVFDSQLLFPNDCENSNDDNEKKFLELFVNFAKNRNPNLEDDPDTVKWIPATEKNPKIYHLDDPLKLTELNIDPELIDFWMTQVSKSLKQEKNFKDEL